MNKTLTDRQQQILALVIREFIESGAPVGSKLLVKRYELEVSSATVRNELAALSDAGYLVQQHTSAGRMPSELGYRYFVQRLIGEFELPIDERQMISHQFHQARLDLAQWMRLAAAVLAHTSRGASIVTAPQPRSNRFKHVQLISTQGRLVLMILVFYGGHVKQQMLTLTEPVSQIQLTSATDKLNNLFDNSTYDEINSRQSQLEDSLERDVTRLLLDSLWRADRRRINDIYRDGLANIIEDEGTRQAVRVLEEGPFLASVLNETLEPDINGVQVVIGGEGRWEELKDCTMILSRYGEFEQLYGAVAVVGPTRMPYGRNISAVRYVADIMSDFINDYYLEESISDEFIDLALDDVTS
jgi:heat-inducible transcriptional repressor